MSVKTYKRYNKDKRCIDCGNQLSRLAKARCWDCHVKFSRGINHHAYKNGKPRCVDCGEEARFYGATRCVDCYYISKKKKLIIYCCQDCGNKISKRSALYGLGRCKKCAKTGKNSNQYIDGRTITQYLCKDCNKKIHQSSVLYRSKTQLCKSCVRKGNRSPLFGKRGKQTNGYIHGLAYQPYNSSFNRHLKNTIRQRDNFKCQCCELIEKHNKSLSIHHIDYNKENCKVSNLISLCPSCHSKSNGDRDYWFAYYTYLMENCK